MGSVRLPRRSAPAAAGELGHVAGRLEDRLHATVDQRLRARGWGPVVVAQTGYGLAGSFVRILARVTLQPPDAVTPSAGDVRGWRRFLSQSAPGVPVTIRVGTDPVVEVRVDSDREGYVDQRIEVDLDPGPATATLAVTGRDGEVRVPAALHVVAPGPGPALLSDIDDTVVITNLPRPLVALRNAFWLREDQRRAVPGMAELYARVLEADPDTFVVYLSTGAWNAAPGLRHFLAAHGYPVAPMLLTDWGPTPRGWFRSGREHKRTQLARLLAELPERSWLLVGDDGQHDPSLYAETLAGHPDQVRAVAIRRLDPAEQIFTHLGPDAPDRTAGEAVAAEHDRVWVSAPDGAGLLARLRARGVLAER